MRPEMLEDLISNENWERVFSLLETKKKENVELAKMLIVGNNKMSILIHFLVKECYFSNKEHSLRSYFMARCLPEPSDMESIIEWFPFDKPLYAENRKGVSLMLQFPDFFKRLLANTTFMHFFTENITRFPFEEFAKSSLRNRPFEICNEYFSGQFYFDGFRSRELQGPPICEFRLKRIIKGHSWFAGQCSKSGAVDIVSEKIDSKTIFRPARARATLSVGNVRISTEFDHPMHTADEKRRKHMKWKMR